MASMSDSAICLDARIVADALSEAGFAIADWQVSGDLVPRSQLTPTAKSLVELLRNRCEPQIGEAKAPTIWTDPLE